MSIYTFPVPVHVLTARCDSRDAALCGCERESLTDRMRPYWVIAMLCTVQFLFSVRPEHEQSLSPPGFSPPRHHKERQMTNERLKGAAKKKREEKEKRFVLLRVRSPCPHPHAPLHLPALSPQSFPPLPGSGPPPLPRTTPPCTPPWWFARSLKLIGCTARLPIGHGP